MPRTWRPGQAVITASQCDRLTPGRLYWLVTYRRRQYWIGQAQGPAAHVARAQAESLARYLEAGQVPGQGHPPGRKAPRTRKTGALR